MSDIVFSLFANSSADIVTMHDPSGATLKASNGAAYLYGTSAVFPQSSPFWEVLAGEDAALLSAAFHSVLHDGGTRYVTWQWVGKDANAQPTYMESRLSMAGGGDGSEASDKQLICISRCGDARHGREAELERRYNDGRALLDRALYGIYRSTIDGRFLYVNEALARMLRYDSTDELYKTDVRTLYADPAEREVLLKRAREGRLGDWTHVRWRARDGSAIVVRLVVHAVSDDHGGIRFLEGIAEDVTESLRREDILRRNERMASMGTMLAGVAHELNNPLAAISGFAQIVLRGDSLSDEDRSALDTINHEANRAARIVRDLQTFARERAYGQREAVDINDVVSYVLASQRYRMDSHGIIREVSTAADLPPIMVERAHVEQILVNLVANATQALQSITDAPAVASPDYEMSLRDGDTSRDLGGTQSVIADRLQPTIRIATSLENGEVVVEVRDNGPGIAPEHVSRVFDPFFTTRPEGQGTGLGLAVVHGIVSSYGGTLEVESTVGHGTLFRVSFPVLFEDLVAAQDRMGASHHTTAAGVAGEGHPSEAAPGATQPRLGAAVVLKSPGEASGSTFDIEVTATAGQVALRPLEILVVEDERAIRRLLERYFEGRGHTVKSAEDGAGGLRAAEQSAFDVVICDLRLPGIDGIEVLRRLRNMPTGVRSRCILMSGANATLPAQQLRDVLRLAAVVEKPFEIESLREIVEA